MTPRLYGIPNCDTMKKARAWLDARGVAYAFHDYKKTGADRDVLVAAVDALEWEKVLNRAGTTFRKLPDGEREGLSCQRAIDLMIAHPSTIKRPLLVAGDTIEVGFKPERYADIFT